MSNFWKIILLILLNVIVSASVTYGVLYYWENIRKKEEPIQIVTIVQQPTEAAPDQHPETVTYQKNSIYHKRAAEGSAARLYPAGKGQCFMQLLRQNLPPAGSCSMGGVTRIKDPDTSAYG